MKNATFISYAGDTQPRCFMHFPAWESGETRRVTYDEAVALRRNHPGCFTFSHLKLPTTQPADPGERE
jgi:hypothetical protein